jgi:hypothetical protein
MQETSMEQPTSTAHLLAPFFTLRSTEHYIDQSCIFVSQNLLSQFQEPNESGAKVVPASQIRAVAVLLLLIVTNLKI